MHYQQVKRIEETLSDGQLSFIVAGLKVIITRDLIPSIIKHHKESAELKNPEVEDLNGDVSFKLEQEAKNTRKIIERIFTFLDYLAQLDSKYKVERDNILALFNEDKRAGLFALTALLNTELKIFRGIKLHHLEATSDQAKRDMCDADFSLATFYHGMVSGFNLPRASFKGTSFEVDTLSPGYGGVSLIDVNLADADFTDVRSFGVVFSSCNLTGTTFFSLAQLSDPRVSFSNRLDAMRETRVSVNNETLVNAILENILRYARSQNENKNYQHALDVLQVTLLHRIFAEHPTVSQDRTASFLNRFSMWVGSQLDSNDPLIVNPTASQKKIQLLINEIRAEMAGQEKVLGTGMNLDA